MQTLRENYSTRGTIILGSLRSKHYRAFYEGLHVHFIRCHSEQVWSASHEEVDNHILLQYVVQAGTVYALNSSS